MAPTRHTSSERNITMRGSLVLATLLMTALVGSASAEGVGSVKVPFDPDVGWVVLNTTASGKLIGSAHVHDGRPNTEFSISVRVRYEDGTVDVHQDIATLTTNDQGKGNAQVQVDINPPAGSTTLRRVAFRVRRAPQPLYVAVAWDIPLK
jgi:hypothetical protein